MARRLEFLLTATVILLAAATASVLASSPGSQSSRCPSLTPYEVYTPADVVFVGRIVEVDRYTNLGEGSRILPPWCEYGVQCAVEETLKGTLDPEVTVRMRWNEETAPGPAVGEHYLFFARVDRHADVLRSVVCDGTGPVEERQAELEYARRAAHSLLRAGIFGSTFLAAPGALNEFGASGGPLRAVRVTAERDGSGLSTLSGPDGRFRLEGLEPGDYILRWEVPDGYRVLEATERVTVPTSGLAEVSLLATNFPSISGRLLDSEGQPVPHFDIALVPGDVFDRSGTPDVPEGSGSTDENGVFLFNPVPPGEYLVAIYRRGTPFTLAPAYPPAFYPGVVEPSRAARVRVGVGQRLELGDFTLPPKLPQSKMEIRAVAIDGTPVPGAIIYCVPAEGEFNIVQLTADAEGRLCIEVLADRTYTLRAVREATDHPEKVPGTTVAPGQTSKTVTVIVQPRGQLE